MKWKNSLGFALIFMLLLWFMTNSNVQNKKKQTDQAQASAKDSTVQVAPEKEEVVQWGSQPAKVSVKTDSVPEKNTDSTVVDSVKAVSSETENQDSSKAEAVVKEVVRRQIVVNNDGYTVTLDGKGAQIRSIILHTLANKEGVFPELILDQDAGALSLKLDKSDFGKQVFSVAETTPDTINVKDSASVEFILDDNNGRQVIRTYSFHSGKMDIDATVEVKGFEPKLYTIEWNGGMKETEELPKDGGFGAGRNFFSEVLVHNGYNVNREMITEKQFFNEDQGYTEWVGLRRKYVAAVLTFGGRSEASVMAEPLPENTKVSKADPGTFRLSLNDYMPKSQRIAMNFEILPLVYSDIKARDKDYHKILFSGWEWIGADTWFVALCGLVLWLLNFFYSLIPNYGVAIIILTLLIKFATLPLTKKQTKATQQMQKHKPAIDKIRAQYRSDPRKMQSEMMAYYKEQGINPFAQMAGCLPMILQMPVFISLFIVLGRALELRWAPFAGWITDLSQPDVILEAVKIPFIMPMGLAILPWIMVVTMFIQSKQTMTDPNMKAMVYVMPAIFLLFAGSMPSGLVLYWTVSNLFSIVQYRLMNKKKAEEAVEVVTPQKKNRKTR